ncbi:MAG TPA: hypothetical protein VF517_00885 [Thermoleophilaceae bacterium]|jgi:hypothetical protein
MARPRALAAVALVALAAALVALAAVSAPTPVLAASQVRAPRSGSEYTSGAPRDVLLRVSGRSVEIVAITFPCGKTFARASLSDFPLKRTSRGYRFNADANAIVTYANGKPDENGAVHISGRFSLDARTLRGHIAAKTRRCGSTGDLSWKAKKV